MLYAGDTPPVLTLTMQETLNGDQCGPQRLENHPTPHFHVSTQLIPQVEIFLIYTERKKIFSKNNSVVLIISSL